MGIERLGSYIRERNLTRWVIYPLQVLSFLLFIAPIMLTIDNPLIPFLFIITEILVFSPLLFKRIGWMTYFIWQFQFYLLILVKIHFMFQETFSVYNPSPRVIWTLTILITFIELLIIAGFFFRERAVKPILVALSSVTSISVILIVLFIFKEGYPAFLENDPVEYLIGEGWTPFYTTPVFDEKEITLTVTDFKHRILLSDEQVHLNPGKSAIFNFSVINEGEIADSYSITGVFHPALIIEHPSETGIIEPHGSEEISIGINTTVSGSYELLIRASSRESGKTVEERVRLISSDHGVDMGPENIIVHESGFADGNAIPISISNSGTLADDYLLTVDYPKEFRPSFRIPGHEWDYSTDSLGISLEAGEVLNAPFIIRMITLYEGIYTINATITSLSNPLINDTITLTVDYMQTHIFKPLDAPSTIGRGSTASFLIEIIDPERGNDLTIEIIGEEGPIDQINIFQYGERQVDEGGSGGFFFDPEGRPFINVTVSSLDGSHVGDVVSFSIRIREGGTEPDYGIGPFIVGSFILTITALFIAVPLGLGAAIYLAEYCPKRLHSILRPMFELLAGIPSIIFGLWGYFTLAPFMRDYLYSPINDTLGALIPFFRMTERTPMYVGGTALTAGVVLAIMILPIIISLSEDAIRSVQRSLKEGSISLGATKWQTIRSVVLKKARSGIVSSIILAMGRAIGETMAVLMILKVFFRYPGSILEPVGSMTAIIAGTFGGTFDLDRTRHAIFGIAIVLFLIIFFLNIVIARIQGKLIQNGPIEKLLGSLMKRLSILRTRGRRLQDKDMGKELTIKKSMRDTRWLNIEEGAVRVALICVSVLISLFLFFILYDVVGTGLGNMSVSYIFEREVAGGLGDGGFANAILGSVSLTLLALLISIPFSVGAGIYAQQYAGERNIVSRLILFTSDTLASTPSIVFGAFGFIFFVIELQFRVSMMAAALTLALMVVPFLLRATIESLKAIPREIGEASLALGASKWQTIWNVLLPPALGGITSGVILSLGRAIGETAAIIFTAGYAFGYSQSIMTPVATMPTMIYNYYEQSSHNPDLQHKLYSAAFLLISIVFLLNFIARIFQWYSRRMMKESG